MAFSLPRLLRLALVAATLAAAPAAAQTGSGVATPSAPATSAQPAPSDQSAPIPPPPSSVSGQPDAPGLIDKARGQLDQVLAALRRETLDDSALQDLNGQLDPAATTVQQAIDILSPRLSASKARLDQLGVPPTDKSAPESPNVTADRADQQKIFDSTDDLLRRARLLALQIDQTSTAIVSRRRAIFLKALFERSRSIVSPDLWRRVAAEIGGDLRALAYVGGDFFASAPDKLAGWRAPLFFALFALIALVNVPIYRVVRRILSREPRTEEPDRFAKALGACWIAIVASIAPIVTALLLFALADSFDLLGPRLAPLKRSIMEAVVRIALTAGLARGLLAPTRPHWRLVAIQSVTAERLSRLAIALAVVVSAAKIVDSLNEIIGASLPLTAATQGIGAFIFAAVVAAAIFGLGEESDDEEECLGPRVARAPRWAAPLRVVVWLALLAIAGAALTGFIPFASFIVDQMVWIAGVVAALLILVPLVTEGIERSFQPSTRLGRTLVTSLGLRRDGVTQFGILLSGVTQLVLLAIGAIAVVAPWGVQSDDLLGALRNSFFGFKIGEVTISPLSIVVALVGFGLVIAATRGVQKWLDDRLMPATDLDAGLRNSIRTSVGYLGFILGASLALSWVGLGLDKIAIVAGALSVGIGFGLQSIFNNFVSGIIVLWERAVRVGDLVVIGDEQGFVRKINVRATEIETLDRAAMIVPNSNLITGVVKNWVRNDRVGRIKISATVNVGADPERVREIMSGAAKEHEQVAKIPAPITLFTAMEPGGLKFELVCFVEDVVTSGRVKSDLHYAIFAAFKEAGVSIGAPAGVSQVAVQGPAIDALAQALSRVK
ncbi:MAG: mechanosensitive ion channel family protein [Hyphomicrobiales bacterium]|nr:mechanosensitive ion channel family protein [Hyphomicrobiales bacterium]